MRGMDIEDNAKIFFSRRKHMFDTSLEPSRRVGSNDGS